MALRYDQAAKSSSLSILATLYMSLQIPKGDQASTHIPPWQVQGAFRALPKLPQSRCPLELLWALQLELQLELQRHLLSCFYSSRDALCLGGAAEMTTFQRYLGRYIPPDNKWCLMYTKDFNEGTRTCSRCLHCL